jgi:hypothetical protein
MEIIYSLLGGGMGVRSHKLHEMHLQHHSFL